MHLKSSKQSNVYLTLAVGLDLTHTARVECLVFLGGLEQEIYLPVPQSMLLPVAAGVHS